MYDKDIHDSEIDITGTIFIIGMIAIIIISALACAYRFVVINPQEAAEAQWCAEHGYPERRRIGGEIYCHRTGAYGAEEILKVEE